MAAAFFRKAPHRNDQYLTPLAKRVWAAIPFEFVRDPLDGNESRFGLAYRGRLVAGYVMRPDYDALPPFTLRAWLVDIRLPFIGYVKRVAIPGDPDFSR